MWHIQSYQGPAECFESLFKNEALKSGGENGDRLVQGNMSHCRASGLRGKEVGRQRVEKHVRISGCCFSEDSAAPESTKFVQGNNFGVY